MREKRTEILQIIRNSLATLKKVDQSLKSKKICVRAKTSLKKSAFLVLATPKQKNIRDVAHTENKRKKKLKM